MNLSIAYKEEYSQLSALRNFIESGTMLASVNYWRDSLQGYKEFMTVENRSEFVFRNEQYAANEFIIAFFKEDFPSGSEKLSMSDASRIMSMIRDKEGEETYLLFKDCILKYCIEIAKSSKEDWLAFIGLTDSISDKEAVFLRNLEILLRNS
jgi:hypothetical protein